MFPKAILVRRLCLAALACLTILHCSILIAQQDANSDSERVDQIRRDLIPPGRGGGLYGNDLPFWSERASDFFTSKAMLQAADAITKRDQQRLQEAIQQVPTIDSPGRAGVTLLYWSYLQGNLEAFKLLLSRGASPDVAATEELKIDPPLGIGKTVGIGLLALTSSGKASRPGFFEAGLGFTKLPNQRDQFGRTFLHSWATRLKSDKQQAVLRRIIAAGVDVNAVNDFGETALQDAASWNPQSMLILLDAGADSSIPMEDGTSLIELVRRRTQQDFFPEAFEQVLQRLDPPALSQAFTRSVVERLDLSDGQRAELKKLQSHVDQRLGEILSHDQLRKLRQASP